MSAPEVPPTAKRPNLATAFMRAERPAHWVGAIAGTVVVGIGTAAAQITANDFAGILVLPLSAGVAFLIAILVYPRQLWRAMEAFAYEGRFEVDEFVRLNGRPVPLDPVSARAFLDTPPSHATLLQHAEVAAANGWIAQARGRAAAFVPADAMEETSLHSLLAFVDYYDGRSPDLEALRDAASRVTGPEAGRAQVLLAISESRFAVGAGDPRWFMPLARARAGLPASATRIARRDQWPRLLVSAATAPVVAFVVLWVLAWLT